MGPGPDSPIEELAMWVLGFHDACTIHGRETTRLFDQAKRLADEVMRLRVEQSRETWTGENDQPPGVQARWS